MGHRDPIIQKHIYSLRSNSWRKIKNNPFPIHTQAQHGAPSYGGSIHWLAATDLLAFPTLIVALDLGTEEYCFVPLPENIDQKSSSHFGTLGLLGGSLCVTSIFRLLDKCRVDVWVMKNYMVKESWMNLFSFLQNGIDPIVRVKPLAFFKNDEEDGRVLLVEIMNDRVFWYNYKTGNKVDQIDGLRNFMAKHVCLRTLVSLSKYGMVDDGIRKRLIIQDKSKQKKRKTC
ncbi:hypothetical protein COLO4_15715 [Corchorus olitorius]|uniref:F-box associated beta-propeller type 1 domain-containing protein n=1 Tax=Corchorus olitorius TaxID=93759 RepID=A0A1R3JLM0_9ROSI|nr:hypothetical protein COLO4_15715 [Corchorus olitorius]